MPQLPAGWKEATLEEVADVWNGYAFKSSDLWEKADNTFPVFKMWNIERWGWLKITGKEDYYCWNIEIDKKFFTQKHDILISMTDMQASMELLWYSARIKNEKFIVNQRVGIIRPILWKINPLYLSYFMNTKFYINRLRTTANSWVQVNLTTAWIKNSLIHLPPLPEQQAIAAVLSSFDDKIELLRAENQTLEQMGQELFKERFGKWKVGDVLPQGWRVGKLGEEFDVSIGRTPPRAESEWFSNKPIGKKWISIKDMVNSWIYIFNTSEFLTDEAIAKFNIPIIPNNTTILSFKMTVGKLAITTEDMLSNEAIAHFKLKSNSLLSSEFIYCYLSNLDFNSLWSTSSIVTAINSTIIKELSCIIPDQETLSKFDLVIKPLFNKIRANSEQIQTLSSTRDQLLPKLMSGEVRVEF